MPIGYIPFSPYPSQLQWQYIPMPMAGYPQYFTWVPPAPWPEPSAGIANITDLESIPPPKVYDEEYVIDDEEEKEEVSNVPSHILKPDKPKQRWKRDNDRKMFQFIREYCKKSGDTMQNIIHRIKENPNGQLNFWSVVAHKMNWRGPVGTLQQRFVKLHNPSKLSVREEQLLQKLYNKKKNDSNIKWDSILYYFPGRTLEIVQSTVRKFYKPFGAIEIDDDSEWFELMHQKLFKIVKSDKNHSQPKDTEIDNSLIAAEDSNLIKIKVDWSSKEENSDSEYAVYLD